MNGRPTHLVPMNEALLKAPFRSSLFIDWSRINLESNIKSRYTQYIVKILVPKISSKELQETYENYGKAVFRLAISLLKNHSAAEDLVHDVFIRFWTANKYDSNKGSKLSYLLMLTQSMALNQINKTINRKRILKKWSNLFNKIVSSADERLQTQETTIQVQIALATLPDQQRQVLELCYIEGASHNEAAKKLGIPLGTVKTHARRGLMALRPKISTIEGEVS